MRAMIYDSSRGAHFVAIHEEIMPTTIESSAWRRRSRPRTISADR
jgi:hypothetical protein